jgi:outer membrane biosynthesis protein TonB
MDASGTLKQDPVISESSGSPDLDAAALQVAQSGSGHYIPVKVDGKPAAGCLRFAVKFELRD